MPQQLRIDEPIVVRTVETEVVKNVGIPSNLPAAERVVSVSARVEITDTILREDSLIIEGVIRATIYYAAADDPANVVSFRRNFTYTDRIRVRGARRGYDVDVEAIISDIDFNLINERLIGLEFTIVNEIEITVPEIVPFIEERPELRIRRQRLQIKRQVQERNYSRDLAAIVRLPTEAADLDRIIDIDTRVQVIDITTDYDRVTVRGIVNINLLYVNQQGKIEYASLSYGYNEVFVFRGVTPDMTAFVEVNVLDEKAELLDQNRVRISVETRFRILVVKEELVEIPTDIIGEITPVRRTILVERIVVEERTRILERDQTTIPEGSPDIGRVIRATGQVRGGSVSAEAQNGGVLVTGVVDVNILYVADLPEQPVFFTAARITFSSFIDIPEVEADMDAYADVAVSRVTANKISERQIGIRTVLDVNLLVTETVRVSLVTDISGRPVPPTARPPVRPPVDGFITYTIKAGDTLFKIGQQFGVSVNRLIELNNITDPENLQIGQQILIPSG